MRAWLLAALALPAMAAEPDAVMQTDRDFYKASLERGAAAWGDYAADEAKLPYGNGKAEIAAAMAKAYAKPDFHLTWHPDYGQVFGEVAVTTSRCGGIRRTAHGASSGTAGPRGPTRTTR
jgi:hypothetical protein